MSENEYLVALYSFVPFGPVRIELLCKYFGSAKKAWNANSHELIEIGLRSDTVSKFVAHRKEFDFGNYFNRLKKLSISYVTKFEDKYPSNLKSIKNAPVVLYYKGCYKKEDENAVAIVGSRKMTSYGRVVSERFSNELVSMGITIVSGLALGIDAVAHRATLEADGRCLVVLASGLDIISPVTNKWIADKIVKEKRGAILSEYPLGYPPSRANFPHRNRIISGLSKAVVVIEGRRKSGTLLTAKAAAEQGREVFAIPGEITSPMSEAPYYLIENGAKMATKPSDIVEELDLLLQVDKQAVEKVLPSDEIEKKILEVIENEAVQIDEIARSCGLDIDDVSTKLTMMELKRLVKSVGNGFYRSRE